MILVQGNWRMWALYGAISVVLFAVLNFNALGIVHHGHTVLPPPGVAEQNRLEAQHDELVVNRFNACLERAGQNVKKVHDCQRRRYGYVPEQ